MDKIKIHKREYTLPTLTTEQFQQMQQTIHARQKMITEGKKAVRVKEQCAAPVETPERGGLLSRFLKKDAPPRQSYTQEVTRTQELSFEERFAEMKQLVQDYEKMMAMLRTHKSGCDRIFRQLTEDVRAVVADKCAALGQVEQDRLKDEQYARERQDQSFLNSLKQEEALIFQYVRALGQAALLMLKKIDLFEAGLLKMAEDQAAQKQDIDKVVEQLTVYYGAYQRRQRLKRMKELVDPAVNFKALLGQYFGPFQILVQRVTEIDQTFAGALGEIKSLTEMIQSENLGMAGLPGSQAAEDPLLDFLVYGQLKGEHLVNALEQAGRVDIDFEAEFELDLTESPAETVSVANALCNIQDLLDVRLPPIQGSELEADEPETSPAESGRTPAIRLRSEPIRLRSKPLTVSENGEKEQFDLDENRRPLEYIQNDFEDRGEVVIDYMTGLMWQKSGSPNYLTYQDAPAYLKQLNKQKFAGYNDWRLPTIPELMSLLEPEKQLNDLYINPIFDATQKWCWCADLQSSSGAAWGVDFNHGNVHWYSLNYRSDVRAVRS